LLVNILIAVLVFGLMIFSHELGHFITAKWAGVKVNEFALGMGPQILSHQKGETTYSLRLFPIGGFVAMEGEDDDSDDERSFMSRPVWKRMIITAAGAFMNILLGFIVVIILTSGQDLLGTPVISNFSDNAASSAYLKVGDEITAINGQHISIDNDIIYKLILDKDGVVDMDIVRDGEAMHISGVKFDMRETEGGTSSIVLDFSVYGVQPTFFGVIKYAWLWTGALIKLVWNSLLSILSGNFAFNQLSGPIGVTTVISEASSQGIQSFLFVLALITVNLGVFNLLPLPALDGGRLFFMFIELIRGKPISQKVEGTIHTVGLVLLIILMIAVSYNDIIRLVTGG